MATQIGMLRITGTVCGICFYCMDGVYYARQKSSLTGKRVKKDPAFAKTMRYANRMAQASKIASAIYRETVPLKERGRDKYRELVGMVMRELAADEHNCTQMNAMPSGALSSAQLEVIHAEMDGGHNEREQRFKRKDPTSVLQQKLEPDVTVRPLPILLSNGLRKARTHHRIPLRYKHHQTVSTIYHGP